MKPKLFLFAIVLLVLTLESCRTTMPLTVYESDNLKVERLTRNTFRHITYLATESFGKVACNGMVVIDDGEALIFDTPTNNADSEALIDWIESTYKCKVTGVMVTHFHEDCLGGLGAFNERGILSYASMKTIALAKEDGVMLPMVGFEKTIELQVGDQKVISEFLGEGHTVDNIVSYFPAEKVLFGGCLIKKLNASKGYVGDANVEAWSATVSAVKAKYGDAEVIIPGHGPPGDVALLDYTIGLFK